MSTRLDYYKRSENHIKDTQGFEVPYVKQPTLHQQGVEKLNISKKGDWSELLACAWLIEQGYEVFRNVSSVGAVDLVALPPVGEAVKIDVKTLQFSRCNTPNKTAGYYITSSQKEHNVQILLVSSETREVFWAKV